MMSAGRNCDAWSRSNPMTADIADADSTTIASALGIPIHRLRILRSLRERPNATISEIAADVGASRNGIIKHLAALERVELVRSEIRRVPTSCRPAACYTIDRSRAEEIAWLLFDEFTPVA